MKKFSAKTVLFFLIFIFATLATAQDRANEEVFFNKKTHKVHKLSCEWAHRCTKNCIKIKRADAFNRGGVPCKVCGG
ncbi:MAG: hypothetical protein ABIE74_05675 [Pseudomonadota bacterium]